MTARHVFVSFICLLVACLSGCFTSGPEDNASFGNINALADLDGIYQNAGDGGSDSGTLYLSKIVWPKDTTLDHKSIDQIEVRSTNATALTVTARAGGTPVKVQQFEGGKDFTVRSGRIQLRSYLDGANDNFAGVGYIDVDLGLDVKGDGKYRESGTFAGVMLLIPVVAGGHSDTRFVRISR